MDKLLTIVCAITTLATSCETAHAQANANAVTGADDAFGYRTGDEAVGIYDETSVRGFSLEAAGNYRLNGTYFVKNSGVSNFFLEETTVRIGYNTLNSTLPGPSGVVDYRLRDPASEEADAFTLGLDVYEQPYAELHLKGRDLRNRYSYSLGVNRTFEIRDQQGGRGGNSLLLAGAGRIGTGPVVARVFAGEYQYARPGQFRVVPATGSLPPLLERGRFLGQRWAEEQGQRRIAGALVDIGEAQKLGGGATLVFSQEDPTRAFLQLFSDLQVDGTARSRIIATPQQRSTAWSGELRGHATFRTGATAHRLDLALRGRRQRAMIGGAQLVELGRAPFGEPTAEAPEPSLDGISAPLRDAVDQYGIGLTYRAAVGNDLRVNLGVLRSDYRKRFTGLDGSERESRATPWLYNAGFGWSALADVELYGSYSRGLEEAGVAPLAASNRNEVLDAVLVSQRELGLRWTPDERLSVVAAGFDTEKPYAGIDPGTGAYRFLGQVRHRGVEVSATARPTARLTIVAGGVLINPRLSGPRVDDGSLGNAPVGVPTFRGLLSADWQVPWVTGLSVDGALAHVNARPVRSATDGRGRQLRADPATTVNLGLRYNFVVAKRNVAARLQILNVFDQHSWDVNASETLGYTAPRRVRFVITHSF